MREIKFRQPIIRKGKFQSWHYWGFIKLGEFVSPTNDWVNGEPSQQFTGFKDKNGKEIYEGDIIEYIDYIGDNNPIIYGRGIVKYLSPAFCLTNPYLSRNKILWEEASGAYLEGFVRLENSKKDEIIGNIYENLELLAPPLGNNAEPIRNISEAEWRKDDR